MTKYETDEALRVAMLVRTVIEHELGDSALPRPVVYAGALAEIVTSISLELGAEEARRYLEATIVRLSFLPNREQLELAKARPAGRA